MLCGLRRGDARALKRDDCGGKIYGCCSRIVITGFER